MIGVLMETYEAFTFRQNLLVIKNIPLPNSCQWNHTSSLDWIVFKISQYYTRNVIVKGFHIVHTYASHLTLNVTVCSKADVAVPRMTSCLEVRSLVKLWVFTNSDLNSWSSEAMEWILVNIVLDIGLLLDGDHYRNQRWLIVNKIHWN